ncbi:Sugar kinase of the NBD/HSP70 family, may contain an N-terminal HTH domain [Microlunatus sagamiharensis]|uniref:Sugar kinase of the NBD/HSP70 family, may contain an N-terminal HTH domain n=1 Tax=Microlunatus sagamiharensis TaxID=546874 RepID=A0A1H2MWG6_9ACTN|nr:ROK family protein [Microlunatus sagamiharensis]SDU96916.1 Sugar kinase of the NBD/HSP70 family, may contain an N-terminal HTH domain [Microlunatus sagamiharensis]
MTESTVKRDVGLLNPASIGQVNRSRVLELLHQNGPSSRAQLARALNVNRATIASILQPLIDNNTLVEGEQVAASPNGGKPARPLWFDADGLELGGMRLADRTVAAARIGMDGTVRVQAQATIEPEHGIDQVQEAVLALAARCFDGQALLGIGVAASGMVDTTTGTIISLHLAPVLNDYPLGRVLAERFGVPVAVDHHPRVRALGDKWFGHGRHLSSFASVYTGEALGMGIVHEGRIIAGPAGAGGEYGHIVVDMGGERCLCGRRGCWEMVASVLWLRREAERRGVEDAGAVGAAALAGSAAAGDQTAKELLDLYARNLAIGMANNEQMLASGTYVVHGDAAAGGELMKSRLEHWLTSFSPRRGTPPSVVLGDSGDQIALLGGAGLVLSQELGAGI